MGFDAGGGQQYGNLVGGVFVFNLIVGVGALSLPNGFAYAGMVRTSPLPTSLAMRPIKIRKRPCFASLVLLTF